MSYEGSNKVVAEYNKLANVQSINAELYHNNKKLSHSLSPNKWEFGSEDIEALTSSWEAVSHIKADKIIDEDVYIFLFNKNKQWGSNFFHFHFHELQRLLGFIELKKTQKTSAPKRCQKSVGLNLK